MHAALAQDGPGYFVFRALPTDKLPSQTDLDVLRKLTLRPAPIGGYAFNSTKKGDAGDGSRRISFLRMVKDSEMKKISSRVPWLLPLFDSAEEEVMRALPDTLRDTVTRSVYYNVEEVPADGGDAFKSRRKSVKMVPADGNPPHIDVLRYADKDVLGCVSMHVFMR